jgi:hypothetical protein
MIDDTILTESEIIELSEKFLEPGVHELRVRSLAQGRSLIAHFLRIINYYRVTACVSHEGKLPETVIDLYSLLLQNPDSSLAELVTCYAACDFLWIEVSPELQTTPWFAQCLQDLEALKVARAIPIMLVYPKIQTE